MLLMISNATQQSVPAKESVMCMAGLFCIIAFGIFRSGKQQINAKRIRKTLFWKEVVTMALELSLIHI